MFAITMLAPVGVFKENEIIMPKIKQIDEIITEKNTRDLKFLDIFFAIKAGNIVKLDIKRVPTTRIPVTTVRAVINDIKKL